MTTRRTRRQNTTVRPRPRVYEPLLRAHDSNTSNVRETLVNPSKGKRLRVLRVRVIQEAADGRRLYEVYFGEGETIASAPGKAVDTLDIPELGEEATRVFPRDEGPAACAMNLSAAAGAARPLHRPQDTDRVHRGELAERQSHLPQGRGRMSTLALPPCITGERKNREERP